jgi:8-oxo-dGTP pyrophosphatase MutT (NUDIX family)
MSTMLQDVIESYLLIYPEERTSLTELLQQINAGDTLNDRKTMPGHVTASAIVLSPDKTRILLIHHTFLQLWLQPGGHWELNEATPLEAAQRETEEETNVQIAEQVVIPGRSLEVPLDIQTHGIPANPAKGEPAHMHHDFRYVFIALNESLSPQKQEVDAARWFPFDAPECLNVKQILAKLKTAQVI